MPVNLGFQNNNHNVKINPQTIQLQSLYKNH